MLWKKEIIYSLDVLIFVYCLLFCSWQGLLWNTITGMLGYEQNRRPELYIGQRFSPLGPHLISTTSTEALGLTFFTHFLLCRPNHQSLFNRTGAHCNFVCILSLTGFKADLSSSGHFYRRVITDGVDRTKNMSKSTAKQDPRLVWSLAL